MSLTLADLEFPVLDCQLEAYCYADRMQWDMIVECDHRADSFNGFKPYLSLSLFETPPSAFAHWTELAPRHVQWVAKNGTDDTPSGMLYVFEHEPIFNCSAQCFDEAGTIRVRIDGQCDIHFDEKYSTALSIALDAAINFRGVWFGRQPESDCRSKISSFLNPNDFDFIQAENGVSMLTPRN